MIIPLAIGWGNGNGNGYGCGVVTLAASLQLFAELLERKICLQLHAHPRESSSARTPDSGGGKSGQPDKAKPRNKKTTNQSAKKSS